MPALSLDVTWATDAARRAAAKAGAFAPRRPDRKPPCARIRFGEEKARWHATVGKENSHNIDLTNDLKKFDVPTLTIHGDDDQIVPIGAFSNALVEDR